jgi:small-conductance mechanosensitive channel
MSQTAFSLLVSLILLVAGFFLGVLANLVTPKFQNWWAALSFKRLEKRVATLKAEAEGLDLREPISLVDDAILNAVERIERFVVVSLIIMMFLALVGVLLLHSHLPATPVTRPFSWGRFSLVLGIGVIVLIFCGMIFFGKGRSSLFKSEMTAWKLIYDIKELEAKLEKWKTKR